MTHGKSALQQGFTAVELLITLFIASVFLFAGYQLYAQVTRDGKDADNMAKLSSIVYDKAQNAGATVVSGYPYGCKTASQIPNGSDDGIDSVQVSGIGKVTYTTTITCPLGTDAQADLFLVRVKASYLSGNSTKEVQHAIYAN